MKMATYPMGVTAEPPFPECTKMFDRKYTPSVGPLKEFGFNRA